MSTDSNQRGRSAVLVAVLLPILLIPVAAWYALGRPTSSQVPPGEADYMVEPPPIPAWAEHGAGILALALLVASAAVLYRSRASVRLPEGVALALFVVAGLIAGGTARIVTAPGTGANIGGGLAVLFGLPFAGLLLVTGVVLVVVSVVRSRH